MIALYIVLGVLAALILWVIFTFNRLVALVNRGKEAWADIDVQLKRRYDLIPNLVDTVKGYAAHEKSVFEEVTKARSEAMQAEGAQEQAEAENMLSGALKSLFAVSENYPDLKANENFMNLQNELTDTENKIQAARRFYNTVVQELNTAMEVFPTNLIVGMFNFEKRDFFELEEEAAKDPVKVSF